MIVLRNSIKVVFLILFISLSATAQNFKHDRIYKSDQIYHKINELYLSSGEISPSEDFILTLQDAENYFQQWMQEHKNFTSRQSQLVEQISRFFKREQPGASVSLSLGIDIMHHSVPDCTLNNIFYKAFRDKDFITKYENRGRFFDGRLKLPINNYLFLSSIISFRNSWQNFNNRSLDFPHNLEELNININKKATLLFHLAPMTIIAGRDRITMGSGETARLLISENLPPVDHIRINLKYKNFLSFNYFVASIKPNKLAEEYSKMLYAHRITLHLFQKLEISLSEMVSSNEPFRFEYMNPFFVYHNLYDYPVNRNILAALELEFVPLPKLKTWFSFAVDEIDVKAVEENGDMGREAFAILTGFVFYNPFNLYDSQFLVEWSRLTPWMYNHTSPWSDFYSLNFVYEENKDRINHLKFHRFIGHRLGSNAEALTMIWKYEDFTFYYEYSEQGEIPIFRRAYSISINTQKEYRNTIGIRYKNRFWNEKIDLSAAYYYTDSKNFHQQKGLNTQFHEFWLSTGFKILDYLW